MLLPELKINEKRIATELWNHIVCLIQDAFILYRNKKYSSSCFIAFTAFEELGKLNKFLLERILQKEYKTIVSKQFSYRHGEKHLFSITGNLSVNSHITRCYPKEEKWFVFKFNKKVKDYGLMKFRNNLLYYDKNNIPSQKFKDKDARNMIIITLEVLYQIEGFMDSRYTKEDIILECQKKFKFSKKLFR
jgi:AbiV family abortive infection protein